MRKRRIQLIVCRHSRAFQPRLLRQGMDIRRRARHRTPVPQVAEAADLAACSGGLGTLGLVRGCVCVVEFVGCALAVQRGLCRGAAELGTVHALRVDGVVGAALAVGDEVSIGTACGGDDGLFGELLCDLVRVVLVDAGGEEEFLSALHVRGAVAVLVGVGGFVLEDLDEFVETRCDDGAEDGAYPVDPVVAGEGVVDNCRAEGTGRVQTATGEVDASQLGNEEGKTDT